MARTIILKTTDDFSVAYTNAVNGDIIELSEVGIYSALNEIWASINSITVRAAVGLPTRPIVKCNTGRSWVFIAYVNVPACKLSFSGIEFNGINEGNFLIVKSTSKGFNINIENCVFKNFTNQSAYIFAYSNTATVSAPGYLSISNSTFENVSAVQSVGVGVPDSLNLTNCYFKGINSISVSTAASGPLRKVVIDHCTFNGNNTADLIINNISTDISSTTEISNSIFANNIGAIANVFGASGNLKTKCGVYFTGTPNTVYADAVMDVTTLLNDPVLDLNGFATAPAYMNSATDGKSIGFYANQNMTTTTTSFSTVKNDRLTVVQNESKFKVNNADNDDYTVYSINGLIISSGKLSNGYFCLNNYNKGIYFLKSNNTVVKFIAR